MHSADTIVPAWQALEVGDVLRPPKGGPGMRVEALEPVTLTSRLLAGRLDGIATPAVTGDPARRSIYAVRPDTDSHPLTDRVLAELARPG